MVNDCLMNQGLNQGLMMVLKPWIIQLDLLFFTGTSKSVGLAILNCEVKITYIPEIGSSNIQQPCLDAPRLDMVICGMWDLPSLGLIIWSIHPYTYFTTWEDSLNSPEIRWRLQRMWWTDVNGWATCIYCTCIYIYIYICIYVYIYMYTVSINRWIN